MTTKQELQDMKQQLEEQIARMDAEIQALERAIAESQERLQEAMRADEAKRMVKAQLEAERAIRLAGYQGRGFGGTSSGHGWTSLYEAKARDLEPGERRMYLNARRMGMNEQAARIFARGRDR